MRLYAGVRHFLEAPLLRSSEGTRDGQICAGINSAEVLQLTAVHYVAVVAWSAATLVSVQARHLANVEEGVDVSLSLTFLLCARSQGLRVAGRALDATSFKTSFDGNPFIRS